MRTLSNALVTYETCSGERAFVRYGFETVDEGHPGFSSPIRDRVIVEAVFVARDDALVAEFVLSCAPAGSELASELEVRAIAFRGPGGLPLAPVVPLHIPALLRTAGAA